MRAELFADSSNDRDAITEYSAAIAIEPNNPDLYEGEGDAYRRLNDLASAQKAYAQELSLSPNDPIAMYDLGSTDVDLGEYSNGVSLLNAMVKIYQGSPAAEYYLGRGLAQQGQNTEAAKWLTKSNRDGGDGEISKRSDYELSRLSARCRSCPNLRLHWPNTIGFARVMKSRMLPNYPTGAN